MGKSFVPKKVSSVTGKLVNNTNTFSKKLLPKSIYKTTHQYKAIVFLLVVIILFALIWYFLGKREGYDEDDEEEGFVEGLDEDEEEMNHAEMTEEEMNEGFVEGVDGEEEMNEDGEEMTEGFTTNKKYSPFDTILSEF